MKTRRAGIAATARILAVFALSAALAACANFVSINELLALINANVAPDIAVSVGGSPIASGTGLYDFGTIIDDGAGLYCVSPDITFTVANNGGATTSLTVTGVSLSAGETADFVLTGGGAATLAYGESITFTISFDPAQAGDLSATVSIPNSDPDEGSFTFTVSGTGQAFSIQTLAVAGSSSVPIGFDATTYGPQHTVDSISAFRIGTYEVTYNEWMIVKTWGEANGYTFANAGVKGNDGARSELDPVTTVSWRDTIAWCNAASEFLGFTPAYYNFGQTHETAKVYRNSSTGGDIAIGDVEWTASGLRLPTEVEWEYAARYVASGNPPTLAAGNLASGGPSDTDTALNPYAWFSYNSGSTTHPVGQKTANALGVYDMSGNVQELCWDWYGGSNDTDWYAGWTNADPRGPTSGAVRVIRGGNYSRVRIYLYTSDHGYSVAADGTANVTGFRVAKSN